jgi:hypothetical protein
MNIHNISPFFSGGISMNVRYKGRPFKNLKVVGLGAIAQRIGLKIIDDLQKQAFPTIKHDKDLTLFYFVIFLRFVFFTLMFLFVHNKRFSSFNTTFQSNLL